MENIKEIEINGIKYIPKDSANDELISLLKQLNNGEGFHPPVGSYVICRSYNEGINAGILVYSDEKVCVMEKARRLHCHTPKDSDVAWYEGVAATGLREDSNTRVSTPVIKYIFEQYSLTLCSDEAKESITAYPNHGS